MTRVFIVAGIRLYREGLVHLLADCRDVDVLGAWPTAHDAVAHLDGTLPDVALVDAHVPDIGDMVRTLARQSRQIPVVAIGLDDPDADMVARAERGITGYVSANASVDELVSVLRRAADGELVCSTRTAGALIRRVAELAAERTGQDCVAALTQREREVAELIAECLSNKEIAVRLHIEVATVKNHVHNLLDKLRVHRRAEAVRRLARDVQRRT